MQTVRGDMSDRAKINKSISSMRIQRFRLIVQAMSFLIFVIFISGAFCTFVIGWIPFVEPLGFLQVIAASKFGVGVWFY